MAKATGNIDTPKVCEHSACQELTMEVLKPLELEGRCRQRPGYCFLGFR
jgi:hypothetical protein